MYLQICISICFDIMSIISSSPHVCVVNYYTKGVSLCIVDKGAGKGIYKLKTLFQFIDMYYPPFLMYPIMLIYVFTANNYIYILP